MKLPTDLKKLRDEMYGVHPNANTECIDDFERGVQAAFESRDVQGLVDALKNVEHELKLIGRNSPEICLALKAWEARNDP